MDDRQMPIKDGIWAALERRVVSRRDFLAIWSVMTGALAPCGKPVERVDDPYNRLPEGEARDA